MTYKLAQDLAKLGEQVEEYVGYLTLKYGSMHYNGSLYIYATDLKKETCSDDTVQYYREAYCYEGIDIYEEYEETSKLADIRVKFPRAYLYFEEGYDTPSYCDVWHSEIDDYNGIEFIEMVRSI